MKLTIFEGPDGSGKSTAARRYAELTGARYVHLGPFPNVKKDLARLYVDAMTLAIACESNLVLDRCWISEPIYGHVFRQGADRLGHVQRRMLERVAARASTTVVLCLPTVEMCLKTFRARRGEEMLEREEQLAEVHACYRVGYASGGLTDLPVRRFDYTVDGDIDPWETEVRTIAHPPMSQWGGSVDAPFVFVGEAFAEVKDHDPFIRTPFVSFNKSGCSHWFTEQLDLAGVPEGKLFWVNADQPDLAVALKAFPRMATFALGEKAAKRLEALGWEHYKVDHPQHAKRFNYRSQYALTSMLKEFDA